MDWILWVVRAVLIAVGIVAIIMVSKRKKEGIYQGQYYIGIFVIGCTAFTLGVILLIVSFLTDLSLFYAFYLMAVGAIALIIGLVARKIWRKNS
ncbi:MAG: hypothetical protein V3R36_04465 [Dehalococcoidales bacterium]